MIWDLVRPLAFALPPEPAHHATMGLFSAVMGMAPLRWAVTRALCVADPRLRVRCLGREFPNPVGLAAGFDKDARWVHALEALGFGFLEVGTLTGRPQPGNPKPRVFRLPADRALINRIGFANHGAEEAAARLARGPIRSILGINIGRSKVVPNEEAIGDYLASFELLYPFAAYLAINISSPNTPGLRDLQERGPLGALLDALVARGRELAEAARVPPKPILVKVAPDLSDDQLEAIVATCLRAGASGLIATNTTIARSGLATLAEQVDRSGGGGLSGAPLFRTSRRFVAQIYRSTRGAIPIIGVGGIMSGEDAWQMIRAGAALVQVYTGLIYNGPGFVAAINRHLLTRLAEAGRGSIAEVIGEAAGEDA